jgi:dephospho-CoA kinase
MEGIVMLIGIQGKSGSGKTTLAKLIEAKGFFRVSLDDLAKDLTPHLLPQIAKEFGGHLVNNGVLDRKGLAEVAFASKEALDRLNAIFQDPMWDALRDQMKRHNNVVVEGYSLPSGLEPDKVVQLMADDALLIARLIQREPWTPYEALKARLALQEQCGIEAMQRHGTAAWFYQSSGSREALQDLADNLTAPSEAVWIF